MRKVKGMNTLLVAVDVAFNVYVWILIARILLSWFKYNPYHPLIRFICDLSDPYLNLFRRFIPPLGPLDISPVVAIFVLEIIKFAVFWLIRLIPVF